jgi:hypothetical protein
VTTGPEGSHIDGDALLAVLEAIPPRVRRFLLGLLTLPQEDRTALIGRLHRRGLTPNLTELLIDLEVDELAREVVVAHLRAYDQHPSGRGA